MTCLIVSQEFQRLCCAGKFAAVGCEAQHSRMRRGRGVLRRASLTVGVIGLASAFAWPSLAQTLSTLPGQTDLERRTAIAVEALCPPLPAGDLSDRCTELVLAPGSITGPSDIEDINRALDAITSRQAPAQGTSSLKSVKTQIGNLSSRLGALRAGSTGIDLSQLALQSNGEVLTGDALDPLIEDSASGSGASWFNRLGVFVNGTISFGDEDGRDEEAGFDFDTYGVTAGVDYRFTDNFIAGLAFGFAFTDSDFDSDLGDLDEESYDGSIYAVFYPIEGLYIDAIATIGFSDFDLKRNIKYTIPGAPPVDRTAKGDTDSFEYSLSGTVGYDVTLDALTLSPYGRVAYINTDIDGFTETGAGGLNLKYDDQDVESLTTALGGQISYAISTGFGVLTPHVRAEWEHEFDDDPRRIRVQFDADPAETQFFVETEDPDRNYINLGAGLAATLAGGITAFVDFETVLANSHRDEYEFTFGARYEF